MRELPRAPFTPSRRDLLQSPVATAVASAGSAAGIAPGHSFEGWEAERAGLERQLHGTPEEDEAVYERLLDRSFQLEQRILRTPSLELPAIRVKARLVLWLMEMEDADALPAMRHIQAYLER